MSADDRFAEWTRREAAEYNRLPEPAAHARDDMWARIEGSVSEAVSAHAADYGLRATGASRTIGHVEQGGRTVGRGPQSAARSRTWTWAAGIAAALVIGVGVGRWSAPAPARVAVTAARDTVVIVRADSTPPAIVDHLARSVVFLASFREDARAGALEGDVRQRGRDLLTATQILMDSPAVQDPKMRALLEDLELVLVQIAHMNRRRGVEEARIASDAMKQNDILPRLRTVLPQGAIDETVAADAGN